MREHDRVDLAHFQRQRRVLRPCLAATPLEHAEVEQHGLSIDPHDVTGARHFTSGTGNNGSAFAGLSANTLYYNTTIGLAMLIGRYGMIVPILALAGSLAAKKRLPVSLGTFPTSGPLFVGLLVGTVLIVGALTYFPALSLGPIVEQLQLNAGQTVEAASRSVLCLHSDLSIFDLSTTEVVSRLSKFLLAHRCARARLLVDDCTWLDTRASRLRALQLRFPLALEMRVASLDDPVGDDALLIADDATVLDMKPTAQARGDLWLNYKPHAQPLIAAFARRWEAAAHNLPVVPLGLG
jgi:hypothetical protein